MKPNYIPDDFWTEGIYDACERIILRYGLQHDNQHGEMDAAVRDLLCGYVGIREFVPHLRERINDGAIRKGPTITEETAQRIADDIKREMLMPLRDILVSVHPSWHSWLSS